MDQSTPPVVVWWEMVWKDYLDITIIVQHPPEYHMLEKKHTPNPNNLERIRLKPGLEWIIRTWEVYTKKKYKKALIKWSKDTGGGDGHSSNFANYTGPGTANRWLAYIYLIDVNINCLFASYTIGRVPGNTTVDNGSITLNVSSAFASVRRIKKQFNIFWQWTGHINSL